MRNKVTILMVIALAGCGRSQLPGTAISSVLTPASFTQHHTFRYVHKKQTFVVPSGVTQIKVVAIGGEGGGAPVSHAGRVSAILPVAAGELLVIYVGGNGDLKGRGFNGGGKPGKGPFGHGDGYGGGGASDIRAGGEALKDRILVAGGGGGQGGYDATNSKHAPYGVGGKGGDRVGGSGGTGSGYSSDTCGVDIPEEAGCGGSGGSQIAGGAGGLGGLAQCGGNHGSSGRLGIGGAGGIPVTTGSGNYYGCSGLGGGGGGGYYGGGGGGGGGGYSYFHGGGGGGGGGSSYAERSATDVHMWQGWRSSPDYGLIVISW